MKNRAKVRTLSDMARNSLCLVSLCFVLSVAWADHRIFLTPEEAQRWNTPPELIPEQVIREPDVKDGRSLTIPITANINVNTGNNAHSLGFQTGPQGISYSESNSFNYQGVAQSQSVSFAAGSAGITGSLSQAIGHLSNQGDANQGFDFGNAAASSSSTAQNGHASSAASSSINSAKPSLSTSVGVSHSQGTSIRFPEQSHHRQPIWTNIDPNHNTGQKPSRVPKLEIDVKPHQTQNPGKVMLQIWPSQGRWENRQPTIRVHKWHPTYRSYYDNRK